MTSADKRPRNPVFGARDREVTVTSVTAEAEVLGYRRLNDSLATGDWQPMRSLKVPKALYSHASLLSRHESSGAFDPE
jgi:hypothetical protein